MYIYKYENDAVWTYYTGLDKSTGIQGKGTNAFFIERSSLSSIPYVIDDPPKSTSRNNTVDINDIIVHSYNTSVPGNLKSGYTKPISSLMEGAFKIRDCYCFS